MKLPELPKEKLEELFEGVVKLLNKDLGTESNDEDSLSNRFTGDPEKFAQSAFAYLLFGLKNRLADENVGNIGQIWHHLPADTRFPSHTIWQHNALVSALKACFEKSTDNGASLLAISISPVQPFIAKTRKLRDHWSASLILSWLAFEGIAVIMRELGPDHILYPSLAGQPLVINYLEKEYNLKGLLGQVPGADYQGNKGIASLPNKFVALVPTSEAENIAEKINSKILTAWSDLGKQLINWMNKKGDFHPEDKTLAKIVSRQLSNYWTISHASSRLITVSDEKLIESLFGKSKYEELFNTMEDFKKGFPNSQGPGVLYPPSHELVQSVLAACKLSQVTLHSAEPGEKCQLCGERESLHDQSGHDYGENVKKFWSSIRHSLSDGGESKELKENEHLCAVCALKRLTPVILKNEIGHPLQPMFKKESSFPSTTRMALEELINELIQNKTLVSKDEEEELVNWVHRKDEPETTVHSKPSFLSKCVASFPLLEQDKYYAFLLMDGDHLGKLINGETGDATWRSIMHPELLQKLDSGSFSPQFSFWKKRLDEKTILAPTTHASISDSLGSFSLNAVAPIVHGSGGKIIYAGGDDVCAILPLGNALETARKIQLSYNSNFVEYSKDSCNPIKELNNASTPIGKHLGNGKGISISGALLICHHKVPLKSIIQEAHQILKKRAKQEFNRNALVVVLKKRSGFDRWFGFNWDQRNTFFEDENTMIIDSILRLGQLFTDNDTLSSSLAYRFGELQEGLVPLLRSGNREYIIKFIGEQLKRSGYAIKGTEGLEKRLLTARDIAGACINLEKSTFNYAPLVVSRFLGKGRLS